MTEPVPTGSVAGIVLAAGRSRRMGSNKLYLQLEGVSLLRRATQTALEAGLRPVHVVVGSEPDRARDHLANVAAEIVLNPDSGDDTGSSLRAGLERVGEASAVVVLLADMVRVDKTMLRGLVTTFQETGAPIVASRYGEMVAPPVCFGRIVFPDLTTAAGPRPGLRLIRDRPDAVYVDWPADRALDVDTPEDWRRLLGGGEPPPA